jgi:hypothetical protein
MDSTNDDFKAIERQHLLPKAIKKYFSLKKIDFFVCAHLEGSEEAAAAATTNKSERIFFSQFDARSQLSGIECVFFCVSMAA